MEEQLYYDEINNFTIPHGVIGPVHVFGDSHMNAITLYFPKFFIGHGKISKTAYTMGDQSYNSCVSHALSEVPLGSKVLLYFGEIDCRHYLPKIALERDECIEDVVKEVVDRYTKNNLIPLKDKYTLIIPSIHLCPEDLTHKNGYKNIFITKELYSYYLHRFCDDEGIKYIPLFEEICFNQFHKLPYGQFHYFGDGSHLSAPVIPFLLESLIGV